jgi:hypothetical protein
MNINFNTITKNTIAIAFTAFSVLSFAAFSVPVQATGLRVSPSLECVISRDLDGDTVIDMYTAVWGYNNLNSTTVTIAAGAGDNNYSPNPVFRGQPSDFLAGRAYGVFNNNFTSGNVVWRLKGPDGIARTATAATTSKACSVNVTAANPYDPANTYV